MICRFIEIYYIFLFRNEIKDLRFSCYINIDGLIFKGLV